VYLHLSTRLPAELALKLEETEAMPLQVDVIVSCRSVKEYQKTIRVIALCRLPQMETSTDEVVFEARLKKVFFFFLSTFFYIGELLQKFNILL
jgi:hypothetical protein